VAELLRDKTLAMVMRYAHLAPDYKLAAVERMATVFQSSKTDTNTCRAKTWISIRAISDVFTYSYRRGPVAQRLEQRTHNPLVPGSNPGGPTNCFAMRVMPPQDSLALVTGQITPAFRSSRI
jgi:hypothetical protein